MHGQHPHPHGHTNKLNAALHPAFSASRMPPESLPGPIPVSVHGTLTAASMAMWPGHHHPGFAGLAGFAAAAAGARLAMPTPLVAGGGAPPIPGHPHAGLPHPKPHNISHILGNTTKPATTAPLDLSGPEVASNHSSGSRPRSPVDDVPQPKKTENIDGGNETITQMKPSLRAEIK